MRSPIRSWQRVHYFACVTTVANRPDDALQDLREAIDHGYSDAETLMVDDLKSLQQNPHFQQMVATLRRPSTTMQSH